MIPTPFSGQNRIQLNKREYILGIGSTLIIFLHIVMYAFEFRKIHNLLNPKSLLLWALGLGIVIGAFIAYQFAKKEFDLFEQMKIYVIIVVLTCLAMPLWINLTNRKWSVHPVEYKAAEFVTSRAFIASRSGNFDPGKGKNIDGYETSFVFNNRLYTYQSSTNAFPNAKEGDSVQVAFQKGLWGFEYIVAD